MKQTKIETGYSAQLLRRFKLEVSFDRNPFPKTAKALSLAIPLPPLGRPDRITNDRIAAVHESAFDAVDGCAGRPAEGRRCKSVTVKA